MTPIYLSTYLPIFLRNPFQKFVDRIGARMQILRCLAAIRKHTQMRQAERECMHDGMIGGMDPNPIIHPWLYADAGEMALANRFFFPNRVGCDGSLESVYLCHYLDFRCEFCMSDVCWWWRLGLEQWNFSPVIAIRCIRTQRNNSIPAL